MLHPPVEEMLPFLADKGLMMKMEGTIYSHSGFKEWYYGVDQFPNQSHTVKALKIESNQDRAMVNEITRRERSDSDGSNPEASLAFYAAQTWTVARR